MIALAGALGFWTEAAATDGAFMKTGGRTTMPMGYIELCDRDPAECKLTTPEQAPIEMTDTLWSALVEVNNAVNSSVEHRTDMQMWGEEEHWSYPTQYGDTEDFVLEKRRRLMEMGISAGSLLIAVARTPEGYGQALLTVRTSKGDFILDDLETEVLEWNKTRYEFLKVQSETKARIWLSVE